MAPKTWAEIAASGLPIGSSSSLTFNMRHPIRLRQEEKASNTTACDNATRRDLPAPPHPHTIKQTPPLFNIPQEIWLMILKHLRHDDHGGTLPGRIHEAMLSMTCRNIRAELDDGVVRGWGPPWGRARIRFFVLGKGSSY